MSKIFQLISDLTLCYETKALYAEDYARMSRSQQQNLCNEVRSNLVQYVNSSEYSFGDIAKNLYEEQKSKYITLYNFKKMMSWRKKGLE